MNLVETLFATCDKASLALIDPREAMTYGQLDEVSRHAARLLIEAGCPLPSDGFVPRVGLACPNGIDHVVLALALLRLGVCLVPIASELAPEERETLIQTVGLHGLLRSCRMPWHPAPEGIPLGSSNAFFTPLSPPPLESGEARFARLNPAFIRFSSGTTSRAKGVILSHETLLARANTANRRLQIGPGDRIIWILSMAHHFAVSIMLYLLKGAATIITDGHLAEEVLTTGIAHRGTVLYGAPFHHALLAAEPSGRLWPSLRLAISTAAPLPLSTARAFKARYHLPLSQGLGIIEAGLPLLNTTAPAEKPTSVGVPLHPEVAVELRDLETRAPIPTNTPGVPGEIYLRTEGFADAYLQPWQERASFLTADGWFATGDLGQFDSDGYLYLVGRAKAVLNVGGMKCFPEEIEAVLQDHPEVTAVRVRGKEHPRFGTIPVAEIVPCRFEAPPPVVSLVSFCRQRLAAYKIPVDFHFLEELPRTASGKVLRYDPETL